MVVLCAVDFVLAAILWAAYFHIKQFIVWESYNWSGKVLISSFGGKDYEKAHSGKNHAIYECRNSQNSRHFEEGCENLKSYTEEGWKLFLNTNLQ